MSERVRTAPAGTVLVIAILATTTGWIGVSRLRQQPIGTSAGPWPDMRLDINDATAAEFCALPGIGPRLAERIVADRNDFGLFVTVDDLRRVDGIGPRLVERVERYVLVD